MSKEIKVNKKLAEKVIKTVKPGLCSGLGDPVPGKMCVEAAVNFACGLAHDDNPPCVGDDVRSFKISLNDEKWSSNKARAKGMIKIAIAQLGSNKISQDEFREQIIEEFAKLTIWKKFNEELAEISKDKTLFVDDKISRIKDLSSEYNGKVDDLNWESLHYEKSDYFPGMSKDKYNIFLADICLTVLKKMKSPGCKYLYLLNK